MIQKSRTRFYLEAMNTFIQARTTTKTQHELLLCNADEKATVLASSAIEDGSTIGGLSIPVERNGHKRGRAVQNHERCQNANPMGF